MTIKVIHSTLAMLWIVWEIVQQEII
jgi:hypothetical protein